MIRITITDEADDERWTLECGCPISGYGSRAQPADLQTAASLARFHAIKYGHPVDIVEVAR